MFIGTTIVAAWISTVIIHAFYYQGEQYRVNYETNLIICNKEKKNAEDLRKIETELRLQITDLKDRVWIPPTINDYVKVDVNKIHIVDFKAETSIDTYMIRRMHVEEERRFMERIKVDLTRMLALELVKNRAIEFSERMEHRMYEPNKVIKALIKVAVPSN